MDSKRIAARIEHEFPVRIEWVGEQSFIIVFHPTIPSQATEELRPKINARMKELMDDRVITKQAFIDAFTKRPDDAGPMSREELLRRLDITLSTFKNETTAKDAVHALRGALIRMAQAYGDEAVSVKIDLLVALTLDITGI